jgi:hypothetical protein
MAITDKAEKVETESLPHYKQFIRSIGGEQKFLPGGGVIFTIGDVDNQLNGYKALGYKVLYASSTFVKAEPEVPEHFNNFYLLELQE